MKTIRVTYYINIAEDTLDVEELLHDIGNPLQMRLKEWEVIKPNYPKAYNILMKYWDSLPDYEKPEINKQLEEAGL